MSICGGAQVLSLKNISPQKTGPIFQLLGGGGGYCN